uniref:Uncharacterized protein n=1 Tax=Romanomermis culicivorax TaxID=13658 RepID=A0A915IBC2_ROMCU
MEDYENCTRNLIVYVNGSFHVENNARTGNFKYVINGGHLNQNLIFRADSNATNVVFFNCSLGDLFDIRAYQIKDDGAKNSWIKGLNFVYRDDSISDLLFKPKTNFFLNRSTSVLHFVLKDNITLTYTRSMLIGYKKTMEESVESLIEKYASLGNRLQIHLIIDSRDKKVFIGHGNVKNVSINDLHKNDLENNLPPHMFGLVSLINFPIDDVTDTLTIRTSKLLKINVQKHTFFTPPVRYNNKTEVVIITPKDDIDHVIIDHSINDTAFLKCNQSLMVTSNVGHKENRYDAKTESTSLVTVILLKYFEVSE